MENFKPVRSGKQSLVKPSSRLQASPVTESHLILWLLHPPPSGHPPLLPSPECLRHRRHLLKTTATRDQPTTRDQPANVGTPGALESLATKHGPGASPAAYSLFRPGLSPLRALQSTLCLLWPDAPSLLFSFLLISVLRKPGG